MTLQQRAGGTAPTGVQQEQRHSIATFAFESGGHLSALQISYFTCGELNEARDNAILLCHNASGLKKWALPYVRRGGAFDPSRHFLIGVDAIGGGSSSKPSDGLGIAFPRYTIGDVVTAQHQLITERLRLTSLRAIAGPSMASLIGFEWAVRFPHMVRGLALWTPGIRCDGLGRSMIEALTTVIALDTTYESGRYVRQPVEGLRRAGAAFFPHLLSREYLDTLADDERARLQRTIGETWAGSWDANDLIYRYRAIADCDLPARHGGVEELARAICCPTLLAPCSTDQVFSMAALQPFASLLPACTWAPLCSSKGHFATALPPGTAEFEFFDRTTAQFLERTCA